MTFEKSTRCAPIHFQQIIELVMQIFRNRKYYIILNDILICLKSHYTNENIERNKSRSTHRQTKLVKETTINAIIAVRPIIVCRQTKTIFRSNAMKNGRRKFNHQCHIFCAVWMNEATRDSVHFVGHYYLLLGSKIICYRRPQQRKEKKTPRIDHGRRQ